MARPKKSKPADVDAPEDIIIPPVLDDDSEDVDFASIPEAEIDVPPVVDDPAEPLPVDPPEPLAKRERKLAQYLKLAAIARDEGNDGLVAHYTKRYTQLKGK